MSLKNKIISEVKSIAQDLTAIQKLEPVQLMANSALESLQTKESFKDRVVQTASEGVNALRRLEERFSQFGFSRLWTGPVLPSVILRDSPPSEEKGGQFCEDLLRAGEPAIQESAASQSAMNEIKQAAGLTQEEYQQASPR